eukprot:9425233-Alexandrium_andersonii.AAC.1
MCIRDRPLPWAQKHPTLPIHNPAALRGIIPLICYEDGEEVRVRVQSAVSYTHLTLPTICSV